MLDQDSIDIEKARAQIQRLRSGETLPEEYAGGIGSTGYNNAIRDLQTIYGVDTVREAESSLLPNTYAPVGSVPTISQAEMIAKPEDATRDLSGISTAIDKRAAIAARPTPQVEITQQPTPVTDAYVGSLDAASQYKQQPTSQGYPADNQVGISAGTTAQDIVPPFPDPATVPVLSQPKPAPITTGVSQVTTPSPRLGYESGQDVQQSVAPYLQGTVGGQPEFYSPPQIVTTQAQTKAPSMDMPDAFIDPLPLASKSTAEKPFLPITTTPPLVGSDEVDLNKVGQVRELSISPEPTIDTTPVATAPSYATMPMGEAGRGVVSTAKGRDVDAAFDPVPTESAAPDTSLRPKARPVVTEEKEVKKTVKPEPKPEPVQDKKTTRLDSTNPNTSTNITNHLSKTEKESLAAFPSLTLHYTATANRRANEAARGDTSNTDAAKEAAKDKIVCTAMNNAYGFGSYRQAIWLSYSKDYLTKEHEIGYHTLFLPLVDLAYNKNNKFVRTVLEHIARHRTADLRASMQNKKRNTLGRIYRCVLEPLVYTIGKFRIITGI